VRDRATIGNSDPDLCAPGDECPGEPGERGSVVGPEDTKRIDRVATALTTGTTVTELRNADPAYAPPFSPVWDPILAAAKVPEGELAIE